MDSSWTVSCVRAQFLPLLALCSPADLHLSPSAHLPIHPPEQTSGTPLSKVLSFRPDYCCCFLGWPELEVGSITTDFLVVRLRAKIGRLCNLSYNWPEMLNIWFICSPLLCIATIAPAANKAILHKLSCQRQQNLSAQAQTPGKISIVFETHPVVLERLQRLAAFQHWFVVPAPHALPILCSIAFAIYGHNITKISSPPLPL